jgi:hypothetical protein
LFLSVHFKSQIMGQMRNACKILVWKSEGKKTLRTPMRRWEDNIKLVLETG